MHAYFQLRGTAKDGAFYSSIVHHDDLGKESKDFYHDIEYQKIYGLSPYKLDDAAAIVTFNLNYEMYV